MARGKEDEVVKEELGSWEERVKEGENHQTILRKYLGDPLEGKQQ